MAWGDGEVREERKTMKLFWEGLPFREWRYEEAGNGRWGCRTFFQFPYRKHTFLFVTSGNGTWEKKKQKSVWEETRQGSEN